MCIRTYISVSTRISLADIMYRRKSVLISVVKNKQLVDQDVPISN
jgi:hypothetical protein